MKIGYLFNPKKLDKSGVGQFSEYLQSINTQNGSNHSFYPLDLTKPLEYQDKPDIIVHKLLDLLQAAKGNTGNNGKEATEKIKKIENYCKLNGIPLIVPFDKLECLLDRQTTHGLLTRSCEGTAVRVPQQKTITVLTKENAENISKNMKFPIIVKSLDACATSSSHDMWYCQTESNLLEQFMTTEKVIAGKQFVIQQFIPHNQILYKIYVIQYKFYVVAVPSLDIPVDCEFMAFNSQHLPKSLPPLISSSNLSQNQLNCIQKLVNNLSDNLGLMLYGIDIIVDERKEENGNLYVIDINYFPGYKGVDKFHFELFELLKNQLSQSEKKCIA